MKDYRIIDNTRIPKQSFFKIFARRRKEVIPLISWYKWAWLSIVEILFGEELIESLVTTSSVEKPDLNNYRDDNYGPAQNLSMHIPQGVFNDLFRNQLIEVLFFKFYMQYLLIEPRDDVSYRETGTEIDCSRIRFSVFKPKLWQVIAFRRIYLFAWLVLNASVDLVIYFISSSLSIALLTALIVEAFRRLLKL